MEEMNGTIATTPVNIKNSFNFPFSFLARKIMIIPSIRNARPNIAINGKSFLFMCELNWVKK